MVFGRVEARVAKMPDQERIGIQLMAGLEKEYRGAAKEAEGALNGGKNGSSGKKGKGSGADKAKRAVRELLK